MNPSFLPYAAQLCALIPGDIYLVGGSIRDLLMRNADIKDIDLVMPSGAELVSRAFADKINGSFFFLDEVRKVTRVVKPVDDGILQFDFANVEGPGIIADLGRRDFTMNAMAIDLRVFIANGALDQLIDPFNGKSDVRDRTIRMVKPEVLDEDPLRLMRAVRFAATLGFAIEEETHTRIRQCAASLARVSSERVRDELFLILAERNAEKHLGLLDSLGLLSPLLPELDALRGFAPGRYHVHDVLTHSLRTAGYLDHVLDDIPELSAPHAAQVMAHLTENLEHLVSRKAALRFACLLHDIGKAATFSRDETGHLHFYGHDNLGALMAKETCKRFRLSRDTEMMVTRVIKHHMRLFNLSAPGGPSKNALYRYCRDLGDAVPESLLLAQADARATSEIMPKEQFTDTRGPMTLVLDYYYGKYLKVKAKPLVTGEDLMKLGLKPGPRYREILDNIKELQAAGTLTDRQEALCKLNEMTLPLF